MSIITTNTGVGKKYVDDQIAAENGAMSAAVRAVDGKADANKADIADLKSKLTASGKGVGSDTVPVYVGADGTVAAISSYGGNAASATKLAAARSLKVDLGSKTAQSFDGTADAASIGVGGILPVANGGTGNSGTDTVPSSGSSKMVTSGGLYTELRPSTGGHLSQSSSVALNLAALDKAIVEMQGGAGVVTSVTVGGGAAQTGSVKTPTYAVKEKETPTSGYLKTYVLKQTLGTDVTDVGTIDIPKDLVVTSGSVVTFTAADAPSGLTAGTYIKLVIANQTEPLYIDVAKLVDVYTGSSGAFGSGTVTVGVSNYGITAKLPTGGAGAKTAGGAATTGGVTEAVRITTDAYGRVTGLTSQAIRIDYSQIANVPTVDAALSDTSANAVQNKAVKTALDGKLDRNAVIEAGTHTKITYDADGLVTAGADLSAADVPTLPISKISGLQGALDDKKAKGLVLKVTIPKGTAATDGAFTVTANGVTAAGDYLVGPDSASMSAAVDAGVYCTGQAANSLTFHSDVSATAGPITMMVYQLTVRYR